MAVLSDRFRTAACCGHMNAFQPCANKMRVKYRYWRYDMIVRVISNKTLTSFAANHPAADEPLQAWRKAIESRPF